MVKWKDKWKVKRKRGESPKKEKNKEETVGRTYTSKYSICKKKMFFFSLHFH